MLEERETLKEGKERYDRNHRYFRNNGWVLVKLAAGEATRFELKCLQNGEGEIRHVISTTMKAYKKKKRVFIIVSLNVLSSLCDTKKRYKVFVGLCR